MMRLSAAWRKISVNLTTGTAPEAMMSARTCPGPTDGSVSTSPTSSNAARVGRARNTARISGTSTIETSSTTSRSQSSDASSLRRKPPVLGSVSSRRWIVFASIPVLSERRLAGTTSGGAERDCDGLREQDLDDGVDQGCLSNAGTAGDHQHL